MRIFKSKFDLKLIHNYQNYHVSYFLSAVLKCKKVTTSNIFEMATESLKIKRKEKKQEKKK